MSFDYSTARTMVRALSPLVAGATDEEINSALDTHALPRVRMFLLTATDGKGQHIFYETIEDLADPSDSITANALVDLLMEETTIKGIIRSVAARWAAGWLVVGRGGSFVSGERNTSIVLEKQASSDLDRLVKSPLMKSAVSSASTKLSTTADVGATLYMILDVDTATLDLEEFTATPYAGAELPYVGAPEAGRAGLAINGQVVEVSVAAGEAPIVTLEKLRAAFDSLPSVLRPNVNIAIAEVERFDGTRYITYPEPVSGLPTTADFTTSTSGGKLSILPRTYDGEFDVIVATLYLTHRTSALDPTYIPGITGYIYGAEGRLAQLTHAGPHAIAADLSQGKFVNMAAIASTVTGRISDSFFFTVEDGATPVDDELVYAVNTGADRVVAIPVGSTAMDVVNALARDMAAAAATQRVLGAVRPSAPLTIAGTPASAPSIEVVAFGLEQTTSRVVVTVKSVPEGVDFGVVPANAVSTDIFDEKAKSVVVTTILNKPLVKGSSQQDAGNLPTAGTGGAIVSDYIPSVGLQKILDNIGKFKR